MRTTAIHSYKGGSGKTTAAINLAAELAARGVRVLLVDVDGQRNTTDFFDADPEGETVFELLSGSEPYYENLIQRTRWENLDILPSSIDLATIELQAMQARQQFHLNAIADLCEALAGDDAYDQVIIDCPPSFAPQSVAALVAADDVVVPVTLDNFAISGLRDLTITMDGIRQSNPKLRIAGVLISMEDKSAVSRDAATALRASGYPVFEQSIRYSRYAQRMTFDSGPLRDFCAFSGIARDFAAFADEFEFGGAK